MNHSPYYYIAYDCTTLYYIVCSNIYINKNMIWGDQIRMRETMHMMEDNRERGRGSKGAKKSRGRNGTKQGIN